MKLDLELMKIDRAFRPNGELGFQLVFVQPFVPIAKATEKNPAQASIIINAQNQPQISTPYENRIIINIGQEEFSEISNKCIVGNTYAIIIDKKGIKVEF